MTDADETRGTLRWELLRGRGLEPIIDTTDNQKAYAVVIHYHHMRLLDGINRLQTNVRETLGLPTRSPLAALATHNPVFEDPSRVTGVRDYQRGDSPRRIAQGSASRADARSDLR